MGRKKSIVKGGLQRPRDVLLSGPFKKFQTKFRAHCIKAFCSKRPGLIHQGHTSSKQVLRKPAWARRKSFAPVKKDYCLKSCIMNRSASRRRKKLGSHDGICNYADFGTQSLAPDSRRFREESHSTILRDLVKAHPIQPCSRTRTLCACAVA